MKIISVVLFLIASSVASAQGYTSEGYNVFNRYCVDFRTGSLPYEENGKWGFRDAKKQKVIASIYDSVLYAGVGLCLAKNRTKTDLINHDLEILKTFKTGEVWFDHGCHSIRYKKGQQERYLDYVNYQLLDSTISQSWYSRRNTTRFKLYDFIPNRDYDTSIVSSISYDELVRKRLYSFHFQYTDGSSGHFDSIPFFSLEHIPYFLSGDNRNDLQIFDLKNKTHFQYDGFQLQDVCMYENQYYFLFKKANQCAVIDSEKKVHLRFNTSSKRISFERSSGYVFAGSKLNPSKIIFFPSGKEILGRFEIINGSTKNFLRAETEDSIFYYHEGKRALAFKTDVSGKMNYSVEFDEADHFLKVKQDSTYSLFSSTGKLLLSSKEHFEIKGEIIQQRTKRFRTHYYLYSPCEDVLIAYGPNRVLPFGDGMFVNTRDSNIVNNCGERVMEFNQGYDGITRSKSGNRILTLGTSGEHLYLHSGLRYLPIEEDVRFQNALTVSRNPKYFKRDEKYLGRHFEIRNKNNDIVGLINDIGEMVRFSPKTLARVDHFGNYYFLVDRFGNYEYIPF